MTETEKIEKLRLLIKRLERDAPYAVWEWLIGDGVLALIRETLEAPITKTVKVPLLPIDNEAEARFERFIAVAKKARKCQQACQNCEGGSHDRCSMKQCQCTIWDGKHD